MKRLLLSHSLFLISILSLPKDLFSQNVGIGTTAPKTRLHVVDGVPIHVGGMLPGITMEGSGSMYLNQIAPNSQETGILFWFPSMLPRGGIAYNSPDNLDGLQFRTNGMVTRMVIDNMGNVGIGTTSPVSPLSFASSIGEKITLWGNASSNYGIGIQSALLQIHTDNENADIAFGHGIGPSLTERMRIMNTGYDGMLLNGRLVIKNGTADFVNGGGGVWFYRSDNSALLGFVGAQNNQNIGFYGGPSNGGWGFVYNAINSRVGIGTSNPSESLEVTGTTRLNGNVGIGFGPGAHQLRVGGTTFLDGNVGIGVGAGIYRLQVDGVTYLQSAVSIGIIPTSFMLEVNGAAARPGGGSWIASSDGRLKEKISVYKDGLDVLLKINPVKYHYNQLSGYDTQPEYIGVLAQDIQTIAPYMVNSFQKNGTTYYSVDNSPMTYMLINAVKEQQTQIDELKKLVQVLLTKVK